MKRWKGVKPTPDELEEILEDHKAWLNEEYRGKEIWEEPETDPPHDLSRADLTGAKLKEPDFSWAHLERANLWGAHLKGADLSEAHLEGANLWEAHLEGADIRKAHLEGARPWEAHLEGADLRLAHLEGADLGGTHLEGAKLRWAHLEGADLSGAHLEGVDLRNTDFSNANVTGVKYDRHMTCRGIRAETCYGSPMFKRHVQDLDYIEEFRATRKTWWEKLWFAFWGITSDYGRDFTLWAFYSLLLILIFQFMFGAGHETGLLKFKLPEGSAFDPIVALYYSVSTFSTFGFGESVPMTTATRIVVMIEVILGYLWLGGLISILANKLARRS